MKRIPYWSSIAALLGMTRTSDVDSTGVVIGVGPPVANDQHPEEHRGKTERRRAPCEPKARPHGAAGPSALG